MYLFTLSVYCVKKFGFEKHWHGNGSSPSSGGLGNIILFCNVIFISLWLTCIVHCYTLVCWSMFYTSSAANDDLSIKSFILLFLKIVDSCFLRVVPSRFCETLKS